MYSYMRLGPPSLRSSVNYVNWGKEGSRFINGQGWISQIEHLRINPFP